MSKYQIFENYINGNLSESESALFRMELTSDSNLSDEFDQYREFNSLVEILPKRKVFLETLNSVSNAYFVQQTGRVNQQTSSYNEQEEYIEASGSLIRYVVNRLSE